MTAVSCDIHVAERARPRHGAGPGKDIYITAVAPRKSAARKRRPLRMSLPCHFYGGPAQSPGIAGRLAGKAGAPCGAAGRGPCERDGGARGIGTAGAAAPGIPVPRRAPR